MATTTLTSKGQMTLPKSVREKLGLKTGDRLDVYIEDRRVVLIPKTFHIRDICSLLPAPSRTMSLEDMDDAIAEAASEQ